MKNTTFEKIYAKELRAAYEAVKGERGRTRGLALVEYFRSIDSPASMYINTPWDSFHEVATWGNWAKANRFLLESLVGDIAQKKWDDFNLAN